MTSRARWNVAVALCVASLHAPAAGAEPVLERLTIIAPAAPGGGWDQTARTMQQVLRSEGIVRVVDVQNIPGAAGTIGLADFVSNRRGRGDTVLVTGLVMVAAVIWNESQVSIAATTPIARLTGEYEAIVVPSGSPYRSMGDLMTALRRNPRAISWGGGSAGGTDHLLAGMIASSVGVTPRDVNYVAFSGGGEAATALLAGSVSAGVSGYSELAPHVRSGRLRLLALSSAQSIVGLDAPTLREQGVNVDLANWRGVAAPPGIDDRDQERLARAIRLMTASPAWKEALEARGWDDLYLDQTLFDQFLQTEQRRVSALVARLRAAPTTESMLAEWSFPAAVGVAALIVIAMLIRTSRRPAVAAVTVRPAMLWAGAGLALYLAAMHAAGFIVVSTLLFTSVVCAFDTRRARRGVLIGLIFATALFVLFTRGLGLDLPAGTFSAWMR